MTGISQGPISCGGDLRGCIISGWYSIPTFSTYVHWLHWHTYGWRKNPWIMFNHVQSMFKSHNISSCLVVQLLWLYNYKIIVFPTNGPIIGWCQVLKMTCSLRIHMIHGFFRRLCLLLLWISHIFPRRWSWPPKKVDRHISILKEL